MWPRRVEEKRCGHEESQVMQAEVQQHLLSLHRKMEKDYWISAFERSSLLAEPISKPVTFGFRR